MPFSFEYLPYIVRGNWVVVDCICETLPRLISSDVRINKNDLMPKRLELLYGLTTRVVELTRLPNA